jgi:hypothetical protein
VTLNVDQLVLKRASASRLSGEWSDDDYDVVADGIVVGRIMKAAAAPVSQPGLWTLAYGFHEDRTPTYGYEPTREAAMAAFAKSRRRSARAPPFLGAAECCPEIDAEAPQARFEGNNLAPLLFPNPARSGLPSYQTVA